MHFGSKSSRTALFFVIGCWVFGLASAEQPRVAFVTSVTGNGNLSSWPDAGGASGLAAGDAICRARAGAAGLANAENFVAWLSDADDDAFCRVHGLSGKRSDNCGQAELPPPAGPWVRTDGFPFAQTIDRALFPGYEVIGPLALNESGGAANILFMTGTNTQGAAVTPGQFSGDCDGWTNGSNQAPLTLGSPTRTHSAWTNGGGSTSCSQQRPIACFESGPGPALPDYASSGLIAFATTTFGPADLETWSLADPGLTGIAAGDSICRNEAAAAGLDAPDSFKVWLSDGSSNAIDRLEADGPWVRVDGAPVAADRAELTSGRLFVPINLRPDGVFTGLVAHTGTNANGQAGPSNCLDWTSAASTDQGLRGLSGETIASWTQGIQFGCDFGGVLYCFSDSLPEDSGIIFSDRFQAPTN